MYITTALVVLGTHKHITLAFTPLEHGCKLPKVSTTERVGTCEVVEVKYWPEADVTVAIVTSNLVDERHRYYMSNGYTYHKEFIPHITLGSGDLTASFGHLVGCSYYVGNEYFRIYSI